MEPVRAERRGGLVEHDGRRVEGGTRSAVPAISFEGGGNGAHVALANLTRIWSSSQAWGEGGGGRGGRGGVGKGHDRGAGGRSLASYERCSEGEP